MNGRDTVTQPASNWPQIMMQQAVTGKAEMAMSYGSTDIRLEVRGEEVLEAIVAKSSLVLRKIGGGRAGEVAAGRFLDNDDVTPQSIIATSAERTLEAARGRRVLAIQDTTEVNFSGRAAKRTGLGPAGDGVSPGLFCHPLVLVDIVHEAVLGLAAAKIWTRPQAPAGGWGEGLGVEFHKKSSVYQLRDIARSRPVHPPPDAIGATLPAKGEGKARAANVLI